MIIQSRMFYRLWCLPLTTLFTKNTGPDLKEIGEHSLIKKRSQPQGQINTSAFWPLVTCNSGEVVKTVKLC